MFAPFCTASTSWISTAVYGPVVAVSTVVDAAVAASKQRTSYPVIVATSDQREWVPPGVSQSRIRTSVMLPPMPGTNIWFEQTTDHSGPTPDSGTVAVRLAPAATLTI